MLLKSKLHKDFVKLLYPFKILQIVLFCYRYHITNDNTICSNGVQQYLCTLLGACVFLVTVIIAMIPNMNYYLPFFLFVNLFVIVSNIMGYILNTYERFTHREKNVILIIKIHEAFKHFKSYKSFRSVYYTYAFILTLEFIYYVIYFVLSGQTTPITLSYIIWMVLLAVLDLNLVYAIILIKILRICIETWREELLFYKEVRRDESTRRAEMNRMFRAYVQLLEAYDDYKDCVQVLIMFNLCNSTLLALAGVQMCIEIANMIMINSDLGFLSYIYGLMFAWFIKGFFYQLEFGVECEKFYIAVENVQYTCATLIGRSLCESDIFVYKNVIRVTRAYFSRMYYGGVTMGAALPIQLLQLITTYTIVLLQFALTRLLHYLHHNEG